MEAEPDGPESVGLGYEVLKAGNVATRQRLIGGYVHNGFTLVFAMMVMLGFPRLVAAAVRRVLEGRSERLINQRMDLGYCPRCGYDLKRDFSARCPECGWIAGERA